MKLRYLALVALTSFVSGVAFVVACGNGTSVIDAGHADALGDVCSACEKPITASRIMYVRDQTSRTFSLNGPELVVESLAVCPGSTVLIGGGCWVYSPTSDETVDLYRGRHLPLASGPPPRPPMGTQEPDPNIYHCMYEDQENDRDVVVVATAICLQLVP